MYRLLASLLFLFSTALHSSQDLKIVPQKTWLSRSYDIYSDHRYVGSVKRELLHINTIYSVSDKYGECVRGIAKLFSLGTLSKGFKKIKIFDEADMKIGYIKGNFLEPTRSQYTFTDERKKSLAIAQLDDTGTYVKIVHPRHRHAQYALFERVHSEEGDYWEIKLLDEEALDPRFLYIFAAYVADSYWPSDSIGKEMEPFDSLIPESIAH